MIAIHNPLVQAKHDLLRKDAVGHKSDIERLDKKIREDIQARLAKIHPKIDKHRETLEAIQDTPSLRQQYKQSITLYRAVMGLVDEIRALKKDIRTALHKHKEA